MLCIFFFFGVYQNKRGGKVRLQSMLMPWSEFDHSEKGDALYGKFSLLLIRAYGKIVQICAQVNMPMYCSKKKKNAYVDFL